MSNEAQRMAQQMLARARGQGVGAALNIQRQQPGIGGAYNIQRQQPGIGNPAQPGMVPANVVQYDQAAYPMGGLTWLGFGATVIGAGLANVLVDIETDRPFVPQLMMTPSTVIGLLLTGVIVEGTNLFANSDGIPLELMSEVSNAPQIQWPSLDTSTGISFTVSNPTGAPLTFSGGFWGTQVRR